MVLRLVWDRRPKGPPGLLFMTLGSLAAPEVSKSDPRRPLRGLSPGNLE